MALTAHFQTEDELSLSTHNTAQYIVLLSASMISRIFDTRSMVREGQLARGVHPTTHTGVACRDFAVGHGQGQKVNVLSDQQFRHGKFFSFGGVRCTR